MSALGLLYKAADDQQQGGSNILPTVGGIGAIGAGGYLGHKAWQQQSQVNKSNKMIGKFEDRMEKAKKNAAGVLPGELQKRTGLYQRGIDKYTKIGDAAKGLRNLHGLGAALGVIGGAHMLMSNNN